MELLDVVDVSKSYSTGFFGKIEAVKNVSFSVLSEPPTFLGIVGESGSGKSTIAKMILGLTKPSSGFIYYKGKDIFQLKDQVSFRREVQPVFQDPYSIYNPFYRVDRFLQLPLKYLLNTPKEKQLELIKEALKSVGLRPNDVLGRYPHQLSGGERQRIMLARIILTKPKLLVADEPVSMLDVSLSAIFLSKLLELKRRYGMCCVFVTHDISVARYICDYLIVLKQGRIMEHGPTEKVVSEPQSDYTKLLLASMPFPDPRKAWKIQPLHTRSSNQE